MNYKKYFAKTGKIYGVSSNFYCGHWRHCGYVFYNLEKAEKWLNTEQHDFRERELLSRTAAERFCGRGYDFGVLNFE